MYDYWELSMEYEGCLGSYRVDFHSGLGFSVYTYPYPYTYPCGIHLGVWPGVGVYSRVPMV